MAANIGATNIANITISFRRILAGSNFTSTQSRSNPEVTFLSRDWFERFLYQFGLAHV